MSQRTNSDDSNADALRKRVCKACDRCRLKKSKCDGNNPCSRCSTDNTICVFGERKKTHDKVYPKGYVEMLEQQQGQLVQGIVELYHLMVEQKPWPGEPLSEASGHPLTHDILARLGLLETKHDGSDEKIAFEENFNTLQARLKGGNRAGYARRRESFSSESDHERVSLRTTPNLPKASPFQENFNFNTSPSHSPVPRQRQTHPPVRQSPLHQDTFIVNDPPLSENLMSMHKMSALQTSSNSVHGLPMLQNNFDNSNDPQWNEYFSPPETPDFMDGTFSFSPQTFSAGEQMQDIDPYWEFNNANMDIDYCKSFVQTHDVVV